MEVVCEATQSPDTQIKVAALQCLVKILSLYYQYMEPYMAQALFPITLEAMKSDNDAVALQVRNFMRNHIFLGFIEITFLIELIILKYEVLLINYLLEKLTF